MKKSAEMKIDLNATTILGETAFYLAWTCGRSEIEEMIRKYSFELKIDLNTCIKIIDTMFASGL